ncbi:YggT family protein [Gemmatimonas sp.]|jgi:YggT family protein|uniref:YggT family protein n=1 Tax=Gemmatimonas sp. TaxID=1962908 RepID=UPI0037C0C006
MIETVAGLLNTVLVLLRPLVFAAGFIAGVGAITSWGVRTRRISPFSPVARFVREKIDPVLITPMERRLLRAGGTPYAAPWWALAVVVLGGLLLLSGIQFLRDQFLMLAYASQSGAGLVLLLVQWTFSVLRIALFARVIASWVGGGPYSKWWRWSFVLTEWFLAPLRNVIPTIGMIDISVLVAYFGLGIIESLILGVLR